LGFIQGRTFKNSIIIADEMQNSTPGQTLKTEDIQRHPIIEKVIKMY
jgi:predicted ribonuclease YlaK